MKSCTLRMLIGALASAASGQAYAQSVASPATDQQDIIVTATKRGASDVEKVPISISVLGEAQIAESASKSFADFFRNVPGLSTYDQGPGDNRYIVRGVNAAGAGTVGLYLDEAVITGENAQDGGGRQPDTRLFDLQRVEVLKGPQGTTYGAGSLSGTIRYITNKPLLDRLDFKLAGAAQATEGGALGGYGEAMVNIPIVTDRVGLRLSGFYDNDRGWINSTYRKGTNASATRAGRAILRLIPFTGTTVDLTYARQDINTKGNSYYDRCNYFAPVTGTACVPTNSTTQQNDVIPVPFIDHATTYAFVSESKVAGGTVTLAASRVERRTVFNRDVSGVFAFFLGSSPSASDSRSMLTQPKNRTLTTEEARYASNWGGPVQILLGGFHSFESRDFRSSIYLVDSNGQFNVNGPRYLDRSLHETLDQIAGFGEVTIDLPQHFQLLGGLRYASFLSTGQATLYVPFFGSVLNPPTVSPMLRHPDHATVGRAEANWRPNTDLMLYASFSQGFRAGGVQDQGAGFVTGNGIPDGYGSDSLNHYELGFKSRLAGRALTINGAVYHIDWDKIQLKAQATALTVVNGNTISTVYPYVLNGGAAVVDGGELTVDFHQTNGFDAGIALAYTNARLSKNDPAGSTTGGRKGDQLPYVPKFTISASSSYRHAIGLCSGCVGRIGADVSYSGSTASELNNISPSLAPFYRHFNAYAVVNLSTGLAIDRHWDLSFNVKNLLGASTTTDVFRDLDDPTYTTWDRYLRVRPRTYRLQISYRY